MHKAIRIISFCVFIIFIKERLASVRLAKIIIKDAIACAIKYLIAVSVERGVNLIIRRGISLIKLISSPSQQVNHELAEHATTVPVTKVVKNAIWYDLIKIKKKEGCTLICGV
jgi:hypothetical protein